MKLFCKLKTLWNDFKSRLSRAEKVGLILLVRSEEHTSELQSQR